MTSTPPPAGPTSGPDAPAPGSPWPTDRPAPMGTGPRVTADQVRDLSRLRRITVDRKIGGVAGGIARHLDIDPLVVRVTFVVLTLFGGAGLVMYAAGWLLLPEDGEQRQPLGLDDRSRSVALILAGVLGLCLLVGQWDWFWVPGPVILVGLVVWLLVSKRNENQPAPTQPSAPSVAPPGAGPNAVTPDQRSGSSPVAPAYERAVPSDAAPAYAPYQASYQPTYEQSHHEEYQPPAPPLATRYVTPPPRNPRKRGPKLFWFTMALAALAVGIVGIVDVSGGPVADSTYPAVVLGVVGVMLVIGSFFGRAGGLILVGLLAAAATGIGLASEKWDTENVEIVPATSAQVEDSYSYDVGEYVLDLTQLSDPEELDDRTIEMSLDVGELDVVVPPDMDVTVTGSVDGPGGITLFGEDSGGIDTTDSRTYDGGPGAPHLTLDLQLDVGHIDVRTR
jgi:phage shock protein PspC (stress-responsive transcriptional regulator)